MREKYKVAVTLVSIIVLIFTVKIFATEDVYNIAITFGKQSKSERNITWNTKNGGITKITLINQQGEEVVYDSISKPVNAFTEYNKDKSIFYKESNKTSFYTHKVYLSNLLDGEKYTYKIGTKEGSFKIDNEKDNFSFLYFTDPQAFSTMDFKAWEKTSNNAITKFPDSSFFVISGDLIDRGSSERLWNGFFSYGKNILSNYSIAPAIGNHESDTGEHTFMEHFAFNKHNNPNLPEYVYSFDYENAHFSVLSTEMSYGQIISKDENVKNRANQLINDQLEWLKNDVTQSNKKWNFVVFHKGLNPSGAYYNDATVKELKKRFTPVFDELSIDVVLQGHDHTYSMAYWYGGEKTPYATEVAGTIHKSDDKPGTLYLIGNSAGTKFYNIKSGVKFDYLASQPKKSIYTNIKVSDEKIVLDSYAVMGELTDQLFVTLSIYK